MSAETKQSEYDVADRKKSSDSAESLTYRSVNKPLLIVSAVVVLVLSTSVYFLRGYRKDQLGVYFSGRAEQLADEENWRKASFYLQQYLQLRPNDYAARVRLIEIVQELRDRRSDRTFLVNLLYETIGLAGADDEADVALFRSLLADELLLLRDYTAAAREAELLIEAGAGEYEAGVLRVAALAKFATVPARGLIADTERERLLLRDPSKADGGGRGLSILRTLELAIVANPTDVPLSVITATLYREHPTIADEAGASASAIADRLMDAIVEQAQNAEAHLARYRYRRRFLLPDAAEDLEAALAIDPVNYDANLLAALLETSRRGEDWQARSQAYYEQAIDSRPNDARGHLGLSRMHWIQGDFDQAIDVLRKAEEEVPQPAFGTRFQLAEYLLGIERYEEAAEAVELLKRDLDLELSRFPEESRVRLGNQLRLLEARLSAHDGDVVSALSSFRTILTSTEESLSDNYTTLLRHKANRGVTEILTGLGKWGQTGEELAVIADRLFAIVSADLPSAIGEEANELFENLRQTSLEHRQTRLRSADAFLRAGRPEEALLQLDKLEKERAESASVSWRAGRPTESAEQLEKLKRQNEAVTRLAALTWLRIELNRQASLPAEQRRWDEFKLRLQEAKSAMPRSEQLLLTEITYLTALGDADEEIEQLLLQGAITFPDSELFWRVSASAFLDLGDEERAFAAVEKVSKITGDAAAGAELDAALLVRLERFTEARERVAARLADAGPKDQTRLRLLQIQLLAREGKIKEALEIATALVEAAPKNRRAYVFALEMAIANSNWSAAEKLERQAIAARVLPEADVAFFSAVRLVNKYGELTDTQRTGLDRMIETIRSDRPKWRRGATLAAAYAEAQGSEADAIRYYEEAVDLGDRNPKSLERLALLLRKSQQLDKAQRVLDLLNTEDGTLSLSAESLAISNALQRRRYGEALKLAEQAVANHPNDAARRLWLYGVLTSQQKTDQADAVIAKARKDFPENFSVWDALFTHLVRTGREDEAREMLANPPPVLESNEFAVSLATARGFELLGDAESAKSKYLATLRLKPEETSVRLRYATLLRADAPEEAQKQLEIVLEQEPKNPVARRQLAATLAVAGQSADWGRIDELLAGTNASNDVADRRLRALLLTRRGKSLRERASYCELARRLMTGVLEETGDDPSDQDRLLLAGTYEQEAKVKQDASLYELARQQLKPLIDREGPSAQHKGVYTAFLLRAIDSLSDSLDGEAVREAFLDDAQSRLAAAQEEFTEQAALLSGGKINAKQAAALALKRQALIGLEVRLLKANDDASSAIEKLRVYSEQHVAGVESKPLRARLALGLATFYTEVGAHDEAGKWYRELASIAPRAKALFAQSLVKQGRSSLAVDELMSGADETLSSQDAAVLATVLASGGTADQQALDKAWPAISKTLEGNAKDVELLMSVSVLEVTRGNQSEAIRLLRKVLASSPNHPTALNNLATLLGERENERGEALEIVARAIQTAGATPGLLDTQGTIQLWIGDLNAAIASLEESVSGVDVDGRYYFHLAAAYLRSGRRQDAQQALDKAFKRGLSKSVLTAADQRLMEELGQGLGDPRASQQITVSQDESTL